MSQHRKSAVISMGRVREKNPARRKRRERDRRRAEGKAAVTLHVDPAHRDRLRDIEAVLNAGGPLAARLVRFILIVADKLPAKVRARRRLPKVSAVDARAAVVRLIRSTLDRVA